MGQLFFKKPLQIAIREGRKRTTIRRWDRPRVTAGRDAFAPGVLHDRYAGSRPVGHGLGLAIAHGLVTRLGGAIRLARAAEGGAGFEIDLPG